MRDAENLKPADPYDLAAALAFALRFQGGRRVHDADEIMVEIVAKRLVEHLERAGYVAMKRPPQVGGRRWEEDMKDNVTVQRRPFLDLRSPS